jgi:HK97 family phage prohead protease
MPMPKPKKDESKQDFINRFMDDPVMIKEYPDEKQRLAIASQMWDDKKNRTSVNRYFDFQEMRALEPATDNPEYIIEGLAIPYEVTTNVGDWFEEIIKRGALDGADLKDVPLFVHHEDRKIPLARSRNNNINSTMQLTVDDRGLNFRAKLDVENNVEAKALYSAVQRQDITGMSFSFTISKENWIDLDSDLPKREIIKFTKIYEISALWSPQYDGDTYIAARGETPDGADKIVLENAKSKELERSESMQRSKDLELYKLKNKILGGK